MLLPLQRLGDVLGSAPASWLARETKGSPNRSYLLGTKDMSTGGTLVSLLFSVTWGNQWCSLSANRTPGEMLLENLRHANCFRDNTVVAAPSPVTRESSGDRKRKTHVSWLNQRPIQQPMIIWTEELQRDLQREFGKSPNPLIQRAESQTEKTFCWQRDLKKALTLSQEGESSCLPADCQVSPTYLAQQTSFCSVVV